MDYGDSHRQLQDRFDTRRLADRLAVPHIELDALFWLPEWKQRETDDFRDQVAAALGMPRSIIGKIERGERRIDVIEMRNYCGALGLPLILFIHQLETALDQKHKD